MTIYKKIQNINFKMEKYIFKDISLIYSKICVALGVIFSTKK